MSKTSAKANAVNEMEQNANDVTVAVVTSNIVDLINEINGLDVHAARTAIVNDVMPQDLVTALNKMSQLYPANYSELTAAVLTDEDVLKRIPDAAKSMWETLATAAGKSLPDFARDMLALPSANDRKVSYDGEIPTIKVGGAAKLGTGTGRGRKKSIDDSGLPVFNATDKETRRGFAMMLVNQEVGHHVLNDAGVITGVEFESSNGADVCRHLGFKCAPGAGEVGSPISSAVAMQSLLGIAQDIMHAAGMPVITDQKLTFKFGTA